MKQLNGGKQMTDVWRLPSIARWEKSCGKHPTQKPLGLLVRILLAATERGAWVLDPFTGSSTTGIAANLLGCRFLGIDKEKDYLQISEERRKEIEKSDIFFTYTRKIKDISCLASLHKTAFHFRDDTISYDLPF